jgi:hypothetical protein
MLHIAAARRQAAIAGLQSNAIVKLAQPIDGAQQ